MKVISKVNTKRLVKGSTYEVVRLINKDDGTVRFFRSIIEIENGVKSIPRNFTLENGNPLPEINYISQTYQRPMSYIYEPSTIKVGDIIKCRRDSTYLKAGKLYQVEDIIVKKGKYSTEYTVKVKGHNRFISFYNFGLPNKDELREISLSSILEDVSINLSVDMDSRVIDTLSPEEKNEILLSALFRSIMDKHRNTLDILDWAIQKIEPKYKLKREDFNEVMNKTLYQICQENEKSQS